MARKDCRAPATTEQVLTCVRTHCSSCGRPISVAYRTQRTITTLQGNCRLILRVRRCRNRACEWYHRSYRPEEEERWALPHGEFGLDVIALVGTLRYSAHRSIPEIDQALRDRSVSIAERTVTHLLQWYEELVALHLADQPRLRGRLNEQGQIILAIDGLPHHPPDGVQMLGTRCSGCCVTVSSLEVLLARSLLSACEAELISLLREVQLALEVPICGVISDGQHSLRKAVQAVLPDVPHQLWHFHYLREAAKPMNEADRHAKKELKKRLRGVRPIERAIEQRSDAEAEAIRGYCLAVRSALTDDGRPPRASPGLKLHARISAIVASLTRVSEKRGLPRELECMHTFLAKGLTQTAPLWSDVEQGYAWVHRAAHLLSNDKNQTTTEVRQAHEGLLAQMEQAPTPSEPLAAMLSTFRKVTTRYWAGLFHCYDHAHLPRTNNELEQYFGSARYHERRTTGRKQASSGLVVRGSVWMVASVASRLHSFSEPELCPTDLTQWRALRSELNQRHEARRMQHRFRKAPESYLAALEEKLSKERLPP